MLGNSAVEVGGNGKRPPEVAGLVAIVGCATRVAYWYRADVVKLDQPALGETGPDRDQAGIDSINRIEDVAREEQPLLLRSLRQ